MLQIVILFNIITDLFKNRLRNKFSFITEYCFIALNYQENLYHLLSLILVYLQLLSKSHF